MDTRQKHVAVVGGGISGLTAAWALTQSPTAPRVTVLEASGRIGGKLVLSETGGVVLDGGAESVLARRPEAVELIREVGLGDQLEHPAVQGAGVLVNGTLRPLPRRQVMGIPYDVRELAASGVMSASGLLRLPLDRLLPATHLGDDVAIGEYVAARLGHEVVDRLVEPLLGGVYAGHAAELSLGATLPDVLAAARGERSLLEAMSRLRAAVPADDAPVFASVRGGLGRLPAAVAHASGARVRLDTPVRSLRQVGGRWRLGLDVGSLDADGVVLAVPAPAMAGILAPVSAGAVAELAALRYASVALVTAVYPRAALDTLPGGTGFLVPPAEDRVIKAVTYSSLKWAWLAEDFPDVVVLRASVGRFGESHDLARGDDDLTWAALGEVAAVTEVQDAPLATSVTRWDDALPQYAVGHPQRVQRVRSALDDATGLAVCGAALDGVGVPACVASARAAAARVLADLTAPRQ